MIPENPKKILIIRLSSLGDVLLTTPVIRALKNKYPHSEIDFLVKPQYEDAVKLNKNLNKTIIYNSSSNSDLFSTNYDIVIDLQNNLRSKRIRKKLSGKKYIFKKPNLKKYLLVKFKINYLDKEKTIPGRYVDSIPGLALDEKGLELFLPEEIEPSIKVDENIIGLCPGSKHFTKQWLKEYFIEIGKMFSDEGFKILLFGGKDDGMLCKEISENIPGSVDLSNDNDLFQTSADMKLCKVIVCNDSGLMHTACASGVPVAAIFGSTVKEFGFYPYKCTSLVLENKSLNCRPCSHVGRDSCPLRHFRCMKDITPDFVYVKLHELMKSI